MAGEIILAFHSPVFYITPNTSLSSFFISYPTISASAAVYIRKHSL